MTDNVNYNVQQANDSHLSKVVLNSPLSMPNACAFLWNPQMLLQANCRGYVVAQHMQPEPAKYSYAPNIEAKTFIQPEHNYFAHHPGRFFYIKDEATGELFSAPHEPMRVKVDSYQFIASSNEIKWQISHLQLNITIIVTLTAEDVVERWSLTVENLSKEFRIISVYPYFSIGYMSWMNQSASFNSELNAIVADSVTPYQKVEQYFENKNLKDKTFLASNKKPDSWHCNQQFFEGEGGLHNPDAIQDKTLGNIEAIYQQPTAVMQFREKLVSGRKVEYEFLFGPASTELAIQQMREKYFGGRNLDFHAKQYIKYLNQGNGCLHLETGDVEFDEFVNHWLPRQMFYHGDVNRLSTDPQTRNYIQDAMGMCFIQPNKARLAFITALSQQHSNGAMPDGILLHEKAELKYINQVPHADHGVWLPICLSVYLSETGDKSLLHEQIPFNDITQTRSFIEHIELALDYLLNATDHRGLSFIEQGDWCDPMNMVGYKGKGVSSWLSLATIYAVRSWCEICEQYNLNIDIDKYREYLFAEKAMIAAVNKHFWDGHWYARGITDNNVVFGGHNDSEGRIYLNPQSWAILSNCADDEQTEKLISSVKEQLSTPFGMMMLAPSYTAMREDIGRLTQKHPGVSENGSVYNHAAIFYIYSLLKINKIDQAFDLLKLMVPSSETALKTGQLPLFIPNYYRGAYHQFPEQAGRSSHLFNTGTIAWFYRCLVEHLCGITAKGDKIYVSPQLPKKLSSIKGTRIIRGISFEFYITAADIDAIEVIHNGNRINGTILSNIENDKTNKLYIKLPRKEDD
ncbi:GH36-type glycosyl hydrolase domain-containing protein [Thalassotalea profundi]|uniref:Cellobionic acid phosphorylase n=1 Tax=Thalassotalea profundi TaxID=2036687 RepID=A0ABQ3IK03_9GAMM|nr:NdvB protein [Thalassotalea profundi]GHE83424.1 cellobionic acid phosphorylase [Thalassotalea profundi]